MKFYEVYRFLIILKECIKLLTKNWKFMASVTILSLLIPSIFIFLFSFPFQSLLDDITSYSSQQMLLLWALLAMEIAFLLVYLATSHLSGIATILVSSKSYSGKTLSLQDLFSDIKRTWRGTLSPSFRPKHYSMSIGVSAALLVILYPNRFTISIAISIWIIVLVYQLYLSVVWALSIVVSVVEEGCQGKEALEKAEKLVTGQRLHGFMLNLFFNLLVLISFLGYWMMLRDKGFLNMILFFVNFLSLIRIFVSMAYTVFYFQCKEHLGEEVERLGDFHCTRLTAAPLGSDIPQLYLSVVWALSIVLSVVEEGCQGKEALEKAEKLVKGQRLHGFMLNLFFNTLVFVSFLVNWMMVGDKGFLNIMFFVNFSSLVRILVPMAYTVFYFQCKNHHDEEVEILRDFHYTKLPAAPLGSDVP